jgi:hypothetical protein
MPERRRKYTAEFKNEAAKMVVETSRPIAEIAREILWGSDTRCSVLTCAPRVVPGHE